MDSGSWRGLLPDVVQEVNQPIYHYTDASGLLGIVRGKELWATEAAGMNDVAEVRQGWDFIFDWLARQDRDIITNDLLDVARPPQDDGTPYEGPYRSRNGVFMCCASLADDDANQWRLYGGRAGGYAIELNPGIPLVPIIDGSRPGPPPSPAGSRRFWFDLADVVAVTPWLRVLYTDEEKEVALDGFVANARRAVSELRARAAGSNRTSDTFEEARSTLRDSMAFDLARLAQLMKSRGFIGENEVRVIVTDSSEGTTCFRGTRHGVVRYSRLAASPPDKRIDGAAYEEEHPIDKRPPIPVLSVRLGPLVLAENNRDTVRALLTSYGLRQATVSSSSIQLVG